MKQIQLPSGTYLLFTIPDGATILNVGAGPWEEEVLSWNFTGPTDYDFVELPPGQWSIIGKADELSVSEWIHIIESQNDGSEYLKSWWYKNYLFESWIRDPKVSGYTLIDSHELKPETTLILKLN